MPDRLEVLLLLLQTLLHRTDDRPVRWRRGALEQGDVRFDAGGLGLFEKELEARLSHLVRRLGLAAAPDRWYQRPRRQSLEFERAPDGLEH